MKHQRQVINDFLKDCNENFIKIKEISFSRSDFKKMIMAIPIERSSLTKLTKDIFKNKKFTYNSIFGKVDISWKE